MVSWFVALFIVSTANGIPQFAVQGEADYYRVVVTQEASVVLDAWFTPTACDATVCQLQPMDDMVARLYNGWHVAFVQGFDRELGYSSWSGGQPFVVQAVPPSVDSLELDTMNCPRQNGLLTCSTYQPELTFAFDQNGLDSGDWVEVVVQYDGGPVAYQEWLHVRRDGRCIDQRCTLPIPLPAVVRDTPYVWYVRSWGSGGSSTGGLSGYTRPGGEGDPENVARFRVLLPEQPPSEPRTVIQAGEVALSWQHEPSALGYEVALVNAANQVVIHDWYMPDCSARCHLLLSYPLTVGQYRWYVRYWNGLFSRWQSADFVLDMPPPGIPVLDARVDGVYQWSPQPDATWYWLVITAQDGTLVYTTAYQASEQCETSCVAWPDVVLPSGAYQWFVVAWGPGGFSQQSSALSFTVSDPIAPQLIQPLSLVEITQVGMPLLFEWYPVPDATAYELQILSQDDVVSRVEIRDCCTYYLTEPIPNGLYRWRVRARGGPWQSVDNTVIHVRIPLTAAPELDLPPDDTITHQAPVLTWKPVENATLYFITVMNSAGQIVWQDTAACCQVEPALPSGYYQWMVGSWGSGNGQVVSWSELWLFRIL